MVPRPVGINGRIADCYKRGACLCKAAAIGYKLGCNFTIVGGKPRHHGIGDNPVFQGHVADLDRLEDVGIFTELIQCGYLPKLSFII
jgi:hypothetical protein